MSFLKKFAKAASSVIKVALPAIGTAIGGPVGGAIGGVVGGVLGSVVSSAAGGGGGSSSGSGGGSSSGGGGGGILGDIMRYGKMVQDLVESPIKSAVSQVKSGAWEGEDADAFVADMQRDMLPKVGELIASIFGISTNITKAVNNIVDADKKGLGFVTQAVDVYKF